MWKIDRMLIGGGEFGPLQTRRRSQRNIRADQLPGLARATVSLVAASLALDAANAEGARPILEGSLLRQGRRYVDDHLADEGLGAVRLCQHLRVSRSSLYRVFAPVGGVSQFVKERRLARVHEILSRPGERLQIGRVAEEHGFRNAASFSKAFREQYGYSAREAVREASAGTGAGRGEHEARGLFAPLMH